MRIGQTSLIVFLSKLLGAAIGFLGTLYFARTLGAEVLGVYAAVMAVAAWLSLAGNMGVGGGIVKRISEGNQQGQYLGAGIVMILLLSVCIVLLLFITQDLFDSYIRDFQEYSHFSVIIFLALLLFVQLLNSVVRGTLNGQGSVHIAGLLSPVKVGLNTVFQVALVIAGFGLIGMIVGYATGMIVVSILGMVYISVSPKVPKMDHVRSIYDYAKYAWLGNLEKRSFNDVDILVLTALVPSSLVGVYSIAWSLSKFLLLFGRSIRQSMFPEISRISSQDDLGSVSHLIRDSLAFGGLITIPGLIGGVILSDRLLSLYGPEFIQGSQVLGLLILAVLLHSYQRMMMSTLNAIDRPDISFKINGIFILINFLLNIILVFTYGWVGAAIATVLTAGLGSVMALIAVRRIIQFEIPFREIGYQFGSALIMGGVVWGSLEAITTAGFLQHTAILVVSHVGLGAIIYFSCLFAISSRFRGAIWNNLPRRIAPS